MPAAGPKRNECISSVDVADRDSRLIFNIHANRAGANWFKSLYRSLQGWPPVRAMSHADVRRLLEGAGLEVENWYGSALWSERPDRGRLGALIKQIDRLAAQLRPLRAVSKDLLFVCRPKVTVATPD